MVVSPENRIVSLKSVIRRVMIERRKSLSPREFERRSSLIRTKIEELEEYASASTIHSYVSVLSNEVDTHMLIKDSLKMGKRIVVPVVDRRIDNLLHSEISSLDELTKGTFGLLQPKREFRRPVKIEEIDLIIVPGLAFDPSGNRVGFGTAFYDRFLAITKAIKVGLSYQFQILDKIETTSYDVKMDIVVTEEKVYRCNLEG